LKAIKHKQSANVFLRENNDEQIDAILKQISGDTIKFDEWKNEEVTYSGKIVHKTRLNNCELPKTEFCEKFKEEFTSLRHHVRRINTQYVELAHLRETLDPMHEITCQMDYSENYSCGYQDEPSAVFYDKNQVTIHCMVVHFRTLDGNVEHKSFAGICSDTSHTAPTCLCFIQKLIPRIQMFLPELNCIHYITDSPSSQYRNKSVVHLVAQHGAFFNGITATWNYLETGHGKGPCDGVGGSLKKSADIAVKSGKIIRNAEEFYEWGQTLDSSIDFLMVTGKDIKASERLLYKAQYVKGVSQVHALRVHEGCVWMRETSCFQECCRRNISCDNWQNTGISVTPHSEQQAEQNGSHGAVTAEETEVQPNLNFVEGMFVKVKYQGRLYIGKIMEYEKDLQEYLITFMIKDRGQTYRWPRDDEPDDVLWVKASKIVMEVFIDPDGKLKSCPSQNMNTINQNQKQSKVRKGNRK
jgi:hypothetical protein